MEIVIVGNGPSLIGRGLGSQIDQFPHVVRFNNYITDGYARDVGSKVTIWSKWYGLEVERSTKSLDAVWLNMPVQDRTDMRVAKAMSLLGSDAEKAKIIPRMKIAQDLQTNVYGGFQGDFWPSSGLLAIGHAIDLGYVVTIAGIDSWEAKPYHYYEDHDRSQSHHLRKLESFHIQTLVNKGNVVRL